MLIVKNGATTKRPPIMKQETPQETIERLAAELRKKTAEIETLTSTNTRLQQTINDQAGRIAALSDENETLHINLESLKVEDGKLVKEIQRVNAIRADLRQELAAASSQNAQLQMALTAAEAHIEDFAKEVEEVRASNAKLQERVNAATDEINTIIQRHHVYDDKMHRDNHALAADLEHANARIAELQDMIRSMMEQPSIMTTPWGNRPINAEGMRFVLDRAVEYYQKYMHFARANQRMAAKADEAIALLKAKGYA